MRVFFFKSFNFSQADQNVMQIQRGTDVMLEVEFQEVFTGFFNGQNQRNVQCEIAVIKFLEHSEIVNAFVKLTGIVAN